MFIEQGFGNMTASFSVKVYQSVRLGLPITEM